MPNVSMNMNGWQKTSDVGLQKSPVKKLAQMSVFQIVRNELCPVFTV